MTPEAFKDARLSLNLTPLQCLPLLGLSHAPRISEIENGKAPVSRQVELLMQAYLSGYRPDDWPEGVAEMQ